jgi:hypothetical protein
MPVPPPLELSDAQAAVWRDVAANMPSGWLARAGFAVLTEYTRRVCRARLLEAEIASFDREWLAADGGIERFDRLLAMADRETKAVTALARALRLTPASQQHPRTIGRALANMTPHPSPWSGAEEP